jgi:hypothetical protein
MIAEGGSAKKAKKKIRAQRHALSFFNLFHIQYPMISSFSSLIKKKQRTVSNEIANGHPIHLSDTPGVNGLKGSEQQLHAERLREIIHE